MQKNITQTFLYLCPSYSTLEHVEVIPRHWHEYKTSIISK